MGTKEEAKIGGRGDVNVIPKLRGAKYHYKFKNVLLVPDLKYSFISFSSLDKLGCLTLLENGKCETTEKGIVASRELLLGSFYVINEI